MRFLAEPALKVERRPFYAFLAGGFATLGVGYFPKAPGTWGSLLALLVWWAMDLHALQARLWALVVAFAVGTLATAVYEKTYQRHDPKEVVVDELVGQWLTLTFVSISLPSLVTGFVLFRFFDILKPFPIDWVDRKLPGAWGTMLDDVLAGVFAAGALQVIIILGGPL